MTEEEEEVESVEEVGEEEQFASSLLCMIDSSFTPRSFKLYSLPISRCTSLQHEMSRDERMQHADRACRECASLIAVCCVCADVRSCLLI